MAYSITLLFVVCAKLLNLGITSGAPADSELFLTKYIKDGELDKAKELAADHLKQFHLKTSTSDRLKSFSGYLTVDEEYNSNIFFWFFPALENPETAPVVMWMSENTGFSCLKGVFLENGPFFLNAENEIQDRNLTWVRTHSMLYMDVPVGTGFSFTDKEEGYAKNGADESAEAYEAITQFFTLFSEYQARDFYLAGEFVAAEHAPRLVSLIHDSNLNNPKVKINLKGVMLGSAAINMPVQAHFADYYYSMGLIGEDQRDTMVEAERKVLDLIKQKKFNEAHEMVIKIIIFPNNMYLGFTGLKGSVSILASKPPAEIARFQKLADSNEFHNYLHAGLHKFSLVNWKVHDVLNAELMTFDGTALESILDKGYRVLVYAGQFDPIIVHPLVLKTLEALKWSGAERFKESSRKIWKVGADVAGYVRETEGLTYALVRNSGRYIMLDNPEWGFDLVNRFTSGKGF